MARSKRKRTRKYGSRKKIKKAVKKAVKSALSRYSETKKFPIEVTESTSLASSATCLVDEVSQVAVGTNDTDRIGSKISPTGFYWNYVLHNNSAVPVYVRMIVYLANGGKFTANTDSFRLSGSTLNPAVFVAENLRDITAMLNKHDLKIIYDKTHRVAGLGDGTGVETVHRKLFRKLKGHRRFDSAEDPDSTRNNLRIVMLVRCADNDTTAAVCEVTYNTIYYYKDL